MLFALLKGTFDCVNIEELVFVRRECFKRKQYFVFSQQFPHFIKTTSYSNIKSTKKQKLKLIDFSRKAITKLSHYI